MMLKNITITLSLIAGLAVGAFADPHAFPVPYVAKDDVNSQGIHFTQLPVSGTIKVVTVSGEEVVKLDIPAGAGIKQWQPVNNSSGKAVATGVYLFIVDDAGQQSTGKLVVIR